MCVHVHVCTHTHTHISLYFSITKCSNSTQSKETSFTETRVIEYKIPIGHRGASSNCQGRDTENGEDCRIDLVVRELATGTM